MKIVTTKDIDKLLLKTYNRYPKRLNSYCKIIGCHRKAIEGCRGYCQIHCGMKELGSKIYF